MKTENVEPRRYAVRHLLGEWPDDACVLMSCAQMSKRITEDIMRSISNGHRRQIDRWREYRMQCFNTGRQISRILSAHRAKPNNSAQPRRDSDTQNHE